MLDTSDGECFYASIPTFHLYPQQTGFFKMWAPLIWEDTVST
jgi:hypothetical protein